MSVAITWNGELNDAKITHGVWVGPGRKSVLAIDGVLGSAFQTIRLLDVQLGRAMNIVQGLRNAATALVNEINELNETKEKLKAEQTSG